MLSKKHSHQENTDGLGTPNYTEWGWGQNHLLLLLLRIMEQIVPANNNLLSGNSLRIYIYTYFSFFAFFVPVRTFYCLSLFFSGASDMEMFLVLLVGLYKVRDGAPQLAGPVPLRTGTGVYSFLFCMCVLPSRRFFAWFWLSQVTVYWCTVRRFQANAQLSDHWNH